MDVHAADRHDGLIGRERLDVDFAACVAVERVANGRADRFQIELIDAVADLLVAGEADSHRAVSNLGVFNEPGGGFHDDGHPGLVVGAKQGRAVGGDQRSAAERFQFGIVGHADHAARIAGQHDVAARVALNHLRPDVGPAGLRRSVQMRTQGDGWSRPPFSTGWNGRQHDAMLVLPGVGNAEGQKFLDQQPPQRELAGGAWIALGVGLGGCIDLDVSQESLQKAVSIHVGIAPNERLYCTAKLPPPIFPETAPFW